MIIAQIATIPTRIDTVLKAAFSLMYQVDLVRIIINGDWKGKQGDLVRKIPPHGNILCLMPEGHEIGSDGWKFYDLKGFKPDTLIIICDDDIMYPPDFVKTMEEELGPGEVITVMGKNLKPRPIKSFYRDELECFKTFECNRWDEQVEIPGTCGMAFMKSTCPDLDHTFFKSMNSDIWMGIYCKMNKIPCFVIPHKADWLTNLMPELPPGTPSVFDRYKDNDGEMTALVNKYL
jgi:hypothetical protein